MKAIVNTKILTEYGIIRNGVVLFDEKGIEYAGPIEETTHHHIMFSVMPL